MAQVFIRRLSSVNPLGFQEYSIVEVLEDGVHAGTDVIDGPNWQDNPFSGWYVVDVSDADRATCLWLLEPLVENDTTISKRKWRARKENVPAAKRAKLRDDGRIGVTYASLQNFIETNPNHS